MLTRSVQLGT